VGGEIPEYTKLLGESRKQALDRILEEVTSGAAELLAYGTAVVVEPVE
jgi:uncharacterized protein YbjQ (UPF0145 family)